MIVILERLNGLFANLSRLRPGWVRVRVWDACKGRSANRGRDLQRCFRIFQMLFKHPNPNLLTRVAEVFSNANEVLWK